MTTGAIDGALVRHDRASLIASNDLAGRGMARRLSDQMDGWLGTLGHELAPGWSLAATGGYAGGLLCPGSDIDVVLLHPKRAAQPQVQEVAEALWYPMWDAGVKLSPTVHTVKSFLALAADDLATATTILRLRLLAGDGSLVDELADGACQQWRKRSLYWLEQLRITSEQRWERTGEVASRLEPDLKDGRGGLRDVDGLRWALATEREDVAAALESPLDDLVPLAEFLLATRCELHRATGQVGNALHLQEQDAVAAALSLGDANELMARVSDAARSIEWVSDRFWWRVDRVIRSRGRVRATGRVQATLQPGIVVIDDEVHVDPVVAGVDESIILRVAAEAAHAQYPISRRGLMALSALNIEPGAVWHDRTRQALLSLLGAGSYLVHTIEALEQYELFSVMVPEWRFVRSLPQRNAFHTYTVDRHLLQTVVNAVEFVRSVRRPDLLLMSALLHDLGKGRPEDHTAVGIEIAERVAPRIGFAPDDVAVLSTLVRHHLLLAETATRRDISDARTITTVVEAVGDQQTLDLLRTLTEADSRATGPSAWTPWKARLIGELVAAVAADLAGRPRHSTDDSPEIVYLDAIERVTALGGLHIHREDAGDFDRWIIATSDRPGLFATIAGAFVVSGCQVVSADAWTSSQSVVLDRFLVARSDHTATDHRRVEANVRGVVDGTIDLHARIEQRIRTYDRSHRRAHAAVPARLEVIISNDASDTTTMIDVRAPDGVAVLYRLATRVSELGLEIRSAKVATLGHEVVDVFYVQQRGGDASKVPVSDHERLRVALQRSLTDPVEDQSRAVSGSVEVPQSRK